MNASSLGSWTSLETPWTRIWLPRPSRTAPGSMTWTRRRPFKSLPRPASPLQHNADKSRTPALSPLWPSVNTRLVPTDRRRLQMPSCGTRAHPAAPFRMNRSRRFAPNTATITTTPMRTSSMHASAVKKGVGPLERRLAMLCQWWRLGASVQTWPVLHLAGCP